MYQVIRFTYWDINDRMLGVFFNSNKNFRFKFCVLLVFCQRYAVRMDVARGMHVANILLGNCELKSV